MHPRIAFIALCCLVSSFAHAQVPGSSNELSRPGAAGWRPASGNGTTAANTKARYGVQTAGARNGSVQGAAPLVAQNPKTPTGRQPTRAKVSKGSSSLPNDHGQIWREYDITPYTSRVSNSAQPEQAIVDWILRETGYEAWHSTPLGLVSANKQVLTVYHTPEMHKVVAEIVDRFVNNLAENHGFGMRIVTIGNPNWRSRALPLMKSISVQSPGVQGWMLAKEDAALLMSSIKRRTDYREHNPPHQMVRNGQSLVVSSMKPRSYTKGIIPTKQTWPGFQPELGQLDEGFTLEFSPLLAMDTSTVDAVIKVKLSQVEKMLPVKLEVPNNIAPNQRAECEVPQLTMIQIHERFRWPTDQVLLLSMGVVATPGPKKPNLLTDSIPILQSAPRADALLFIESKGPVSPNLPGGSPAAATASRAGQTFHGRY